MMTQTVQNITLKCQPINLEILMLNKLQNLMKFKIF